METLAIPLTEDEQKLLGEIELDSSALEYDTLGRNGDLVLKLFRSLTARDAIPEHRRRYFTDPEYNYGGRGSSNQQIFERNGCRGEAILRHAHFLDYLRYFLFGPDLPEPAIRGFTEAVKDCGMVTSSDISPLGKKARGFARAHRLEAAKAAEEFYKLSLDMGLSPSTSGFIYRAVRQLRY